MKEENLNQDTLPGDPKNQEGSDDDYRPKSVKNVMQADNQNSK